MWGADATQLQMGSGQPITIKYFFFLNPPPLQNGKGVKCSGKGKRDQTLTSSGKEMVRNNTGSTAADTSRYDLFPEATAATVLTSLRGQLKTNTIILWSNWTRQRKVTPPLFTSEQRRAPEIPRFPRALPKPPFLGGTLFYLLIYLKHSLAAFLLYRTQGGL